MKIPCPNCNQRLDIPEELAGQIIECPICNGSITIPTSDQPASEQNEAREIHPLDGKIFDNLCNKLSDLVELETEEYDVV